MRSIIIQLKSTLTKTQLRYKGSSIKDFRTRGGEGFVRSGQDRGEGLKAHDMRASAEFKKLPN